MQLSEAVNFLENAIPKQKGRWADIGAGTGIFTQALDQLLAKESIIHSIDKDPSKLHSLQLKNSTLQVSAGDFNDPLDLPMMDGILLANALHYSPQPIDTLTTILKRLRSGGIFILIEYELVQPRKPWIPYPITFEQFTAIAPQVALSLPEELGRMDSAYGNNYMYLARCVKE